jgi:hypothetical protein
MLFEPLPELFPELVPTLLAGIEPLKADWRTKFGKKLISILLSFYIMQSSIRFVRHTKRRNFFGAHIDKT